MALDELWDDAPALRDPLQQRAVEQIEAGRSGLARVFGLVKTDRFGRSREQGNDAGHRRQHLNWPLHRTADAVNSESET
ncbi:hypothetical protein [Nocardia anaemiae]|uniref:hypothetical protein n=1 Tax=Nocardia anaemiae TaxID=263910 RepID=UPI0012F51B77|nr:hypothetical protein [Nocardia anaemiae]